MTTGKELQVSSHRVEVSLLEFIQRRTKLRLGVDSDIFATGAVTSLFALELVLQVEQAFGVVIDSDDLNLENFSSVKAIASLVDRLQGAHQNEYTHG